MMIYRDPNARFILLLLLCHILSSTLQKVPLTNPPVPEVKMHAKPVSRTEDDLKKMLVTGLDDDKSSSMSTPTSSEYQKQSTTIVPKAAETTDGSAGFNSGGDVADITSDGKYILFRFT